MVLPVRRGAALLAAKTAPEGVRSATPPCTLMHPHSCIPTGYDISQPHLAPLSLQSPKEVMSPKLPSHPVPEFQQGVMSANYNSTIVPVPQQEVTRGENR